MSVSKLGLLLVIFVDVAGQGLVIPLIDALVAGPDSRFLPPSAS